MVPDSYDPSTYDGLPSIREAIKRFDAMDGEGLVSDSFRELFLQHSTDRIFGLILLHRHFDLSPDERLVEYHGTSVPWRQTAASAHIRAANWLLAEDGSPRPYEFYYPGDEAGGAEGSDDAAHPKHRAFIRAFGELLHQNDALGLFGLCRYPGDDFKGSVEITEGRANICMLPGDSPKGMRSSTAAWFFSPPLWEFKCNCVCRYDTTGNHYGHDRHKEST